MNKIIFTFILSCFLFTVSAKTPGKTVTLAVDPTQDFSLTLNDGGSFILEAQKSFEIEATSGTLKNATKIYDQKKAKPFAVKLQLKTLGIRQKRDLEFRLKFEEEIRTLNIRLIPLQGKKAKKK